MTSITIQTLAPRVRAILADAHSAADPTGDVALDKALADLAACRRAAQPLPEVETGFWNSPRQPVNAHTR